jgi:hypothetical protein
MSLAVSRRRDRRVVVARVAGLRALLGFGALLEAVNFRGLHQQAQLLFWARSAAAAAGPASTALRFGLLVIGSAARSRSARTRSGS